LLSHSVNSAPRFRSRFATARNSAGALRMRSISRHEANVFQSLQLVAPVDKPRLFDSRSTIGGVSWLGRPVRIATGLSQYTTQIDLGALW
jgi:hypothetical protein